jgi:hypothetical protein
MGDVYRNFSSEFRVCIYERIYIYTHTHTHIVTDLLKAISHGTRETRC